MFTFKRRENNTYEYLTYSPLFVCRYAGKTPGIQAEIWLKLENLQPTGPGGGIRK